MKLLIGHSLSMCVRDIARGKVKLEQVVCIIANTRIETLDAYNEVKQRYSEVYWDGMESVAEAIMDALWSTRRIVQPRIVQGDPMPHNRNWTDCEVFRSCEYANDDGFCHPYAIEV